MRSLLFKSSALVIGLVVFFACKTKKTTPQTSVVSTPEKSKDTSAIRQLPPMKGNVSAMAPLVIYKTKSDYSKNVPVKLSPDKKEIVYYPAPSDLVQNGKIVYPIKLEKDFWMDTRGVSLSTAYLTITYEEYTKPGYIPDPTILKNQILDADPFIEMYHCGPKSKFQNPEQEINRAILDNKLDVFKKLK